jgi:hypothetical protein
MFIQVTGDPLVAGKYSLKVRANEPGTLHYERRRGEGGTQLVLALSSKHKEMPGIECWAIFTPDANEDRRSIHYVARVAVPGENQGLLPQSGWVAWRPTSGQFPFGAATILKAVPLYTTIAVSDAYLSMMSFLSAILASTALESIGYLAVGCASAAGVGRFGFSPAKFMAMNTALADFTGRVGIPLLSIAAARTVPWLEATLPKVIDTSTLSAI